MLDASRDENAHSELLRLLTPTVPSCDPFATRGLWKLGVSGSKRKLTPAECATNSPGGSAQVAESGAMSELIDDIGVSHLDQGQQGGTLLPPQPSCRPDPAALKPTQTLSSTDGGEAAEPREVLAVESLVSADMEAVSSLPAEVEAVLTAVSRLSLPASRLALLRCD